jgi:hypothetical protein
LSLALAIRVIVPLLPAVEASTLGAMASATGALAPNRLFGNRTI